MMTEEKDNRIKKMTEAIMKAAKGDYSVRFDTSDTNDNLDMLAEALQEFVNHIKANNENTNQTEIALKEDEMRYRYSIESAPYGIGVYNKDMKVLIYNPELEKITGYSMEEMSDIQTWMEKIYPNENYRNEVLKHINSVDDKKEPYVGDFVITRKDGNERVCRFTSRMSSSGIRTVFINDITDLKQTEGALRESEERYRQLFEAESDAIFLIDNETGHILEANHAASVMYGYSKEELLSKKNTDLSAEPEDTKHVTRKTPVMSDQVVTIPLRFHRKKDETVFPVEITGRFFERQGRSVHIAAIRDISKRRKAEDALRESEFRFRTFIEQAPDAIFAHDLEGRPIMVNNRICEMTGYSKKELMRMNASDIGTEIIPEEHRKRFWEKLKVGEHLKVDGLHKRKDNTTYPAEIHLVKILLNGEPIILAFPRDITERKQTEERIKKDLEEKEVLLKELHHRVKNNLSIINSLLNLQADKITSKKAVMKAIQESKDRIYAMTLVHQNLYQSDDFSNIDIKSYITSISRDLISAYTNPEHISIETQVVDVSLNINVAIPCGLILNELITNAIKYAFPEDRKGHIKITFEKWEKDHYKLTVCDNGVGFPKHLRDKSHDSLGLELVHILTKQIDGDIHILHKNGTTCEIVFPITSS